MSCVPPVCDSFLTLWDGLLLFSFTVFFLGWLYPGADLALGWTVAGCLAGLRSPFMSSVPAEKGHEGEGTRDDREVKVVRLGPGRAGHPALGRWSQPCTLGGVGVRRREPQQAVSYSAQDVLFLLSE